ncbi:unnamed protein product [Adineta steineri]|uniref:Peptidase metallopeptidase domain-containing protein n=2 Tax=Adineta steineri TaxID=433720 RepID=A0A813WJ27_9BILA|nr:unnamed protein product [Adineta steineri]
MQWFSLFILCALVFTVLCDNPIKKSSSKFKTTRKPLQKKPDSKTVAVKPNIDVYKYLTKFGYNPCANSTKSKPTDESGPLCSTNLASMVEAFQIAYGLNVTKKLDAATEKLMKTPRCSLPDYPPAFTDRGKLWSKSRTLTWKLENSHSPFDKSKIRKYIQQAFNDWANDSGLTFREASENAKADFTLTFANDEHGDGFPHDGPGGTLAHAFPPWDPRTRGTSHYDLAEDWSDTYDGVGINFRLVASHEIGHNLGLGHNTLESKALMNPYYQLFEQTDMLPKPVSKVLLRFTNHPHM